MKVFKSGLQFCKQHRAAILTVAILGLVVSARAVGTPDADVVSLTDNATATFGTVKTAAITFLVFAIGFRFARKWLK